MSKAKKNNNNINSITAIVGLLLVMGLITGTVFFKQQALKSEDEALIMREEELKTEISKEEDRRLKLDEKKKYVTTKQYIEEVARDKLGLLNPDEVRLEQRN